MTTVYGIGVSLLLFHRLFNVSMATSLYATGHASAPPHNQQYKRVHNIMGTLSLRRE